MDYSKLTLGELLSSENETIRRNAVGILKALQREKLKDYNAGMRKANKAFTENMKRNKELDKKEGAEKLSDYTG